MLEVARTSSREKVVVVVLLLHYPPRLSPVLLPPQPMGGGGGGGTVISDLETIYIYIFFFGRVWRGGDRRCTIPFDEALRRSNAVLLGYGPEGQGERHS